MEDIKRAHKYRLCPTEAQRMMLAKTFGCCRYVWNWALSMRNDVYKQSNGEVRLNYGALAGFMAFMKGDERMAWLKEVDSIALQQALRDLEQAFKNHFSNPGHFGLPRYKSKKNPKKAYRTQLVGFNILVIDGAVKIPKIGWVKARTNEGNIPKGKITNATVSVTSTGKYFVSVLCEEKLAVKPNCGGVVGIDMNISDGEFMVDSNGGKTAAPKPLRKSLDKLRRSQRALSRKHKGSKGYAANKRIIALEYEKAANIREDFLNKQALRICRENQTVCFETLGVKEMIGSDTRAQARSFSDSAIAAFVTKVENKSKEYGTTIAKVSPYFASSQLCFDCGHKNPDVKDTRVRKWKCPVCGAYHDRDVNAAKNILREGLRILNEGSAGSAAPLKKPDSQSIDSRLAGTAYGVSPVAPAGGGSLGSGLASSVESGIPNLKSPFGD